VTDQNTINRAYALGMQQYNAAREQYARMLDDASGATTRQQAQVDAKNAATRMESWRKCRLSECKLKANPDLSTEGYCGGHWDNLTGWLKRTTA
jgi:hypothetical protein